METDFDEWFKREQEKLEKKFFNETKTLIEEGEKFDEPREEFEKKYKKLLESFENKNYQQMKFQKWKKLLMKPVKKINKEMDEFVKAFREE